MIDWPLDSNRIRRGSLRHTFGRVRMGGLRSHQGWDFAAPLNTPCYAIADGRIELLYASPDYGRVLVLRFDHPKLGRLYAAYCHLSRFNVHAGEPVNCGELIAWTGETGNAHGMAPEDQHLHFEIRTEPRPGKGLVGRISPLKVFGELPLHVAVRRKGANHE